MLSQNKNAWACAVVGLIALGVVAIPSLRAAESVCVFDGHLLCLQHGGTVEAWDLKTGTYAKDTANRLSRKGVTFLASNKEKLWAADGSAVYRWSSTGRAWEKAADFDTGKESLVALVLVGDSPFLVFPPEALDPIGKRTFKVPKIEAPFGGPPLRILATRGTESMLWIGTGNGEWGGTLLGLNPKTGKWVHWDNLLGYVTGITHFSPDEVVVSWSMSHFENHTQILVHKLDGTVKTEYPELKSKYYQRIAYSPHDNTVYGIESNEIVRIQDGRPSKVASLKGVLYVREPKAIGVAPAVLELIPTGPKEVIVVPKHGEPWRIREEEVTILRKP